MEKHSSSTNFSQFCKMEKMMEKFSNGGVQQILNDKQSIALQNAVNTPDPNSLMIH